jgi:hypothetical protein
VTIYFVTSTYDLYAPFNMGRFQDRAVPNTLYINLVSIAEKSAIAAYKVTPTES